MDAEILSFVASEAGSAALRSPQDDEAGHKAISMMAKVNPDSSTDMVDLAEEYGLTLAGASVIELGPGAGYATRALVAKAPASILGIEVSPVFREMLRRDEELAPAIASGALTIKADDAVAMPSVPSSSVDVVFGMNVVYFLQPLGAYLKELLRVLKPGGWLILGTKPAAVAVGDPKAFVNTDNAAVVAAMRAAGFMAAAVAPARLESEPPTPATYLPVVCQKPRVEHCRRAAIEAMAAASKLAMTAVNTGTATVWYNQQQVEAEAHALRQQAPVVARHSARWAAAYPEFHKALKDLGDVENWASTIESDISFINGALERLQQARSRERP